jgi:hypothetical protein
VEIYQPGTDGDAPLLQWYSTLVETEDLAELVGPSLFPLAAFMKHYTAPDTRLLILEDDKGWAAVAWLSVFMAGGTWGLWVRKGGPRHSGSRKVMGFIMSSLAYAFEFVPVLVNTTRRGSVVAKTRRLGYNYVGVIPLLFEGEDCHILYMTREMFQPIWEKWEAYKAKRHEQ